MKAAVGEQSFEAAALPCLDLVYRVARRLARDDHEAEDLVQDTYLKAYTGFARYEVRECGIKPWLLRILHNTFLNRQARQKRAPKSADQQVLDQVRVPEQYVGPPELDYENLDQEVKQAIDDLPHEFREVLLLWATMELSYHEIADILQVPIGTVMSRLHRARQQLAQSLNDFAREHRLTGARKP